MKRLLSKLGLVCGMLLMLALTSSRADFSWDKAQGPSYSTEASACGIANQPCVAGGCVAVGQLTMVPDDETNSVEVSSYERFSTTPYGVCGTGTSSCTAYPNVECGHVNLYGTIT